MFFTIFAVYFSAVLEILKTRRELTGFLQGRREQGHSVGLVPTMGALHEGHLSLIARSRKENRSTVCSIFVNPTQFNDPEDLRKYPRPITLDIRKLEQAGCDALFLPGVSEVYSGTEEWELDTGELEGILEGEFRPGHYRGVTQVVSKLFELTDPDRAYFGQKDYQQYLVISRMVQLLSIPVQLVCCPTVREADGLAMSSRNVHLSPEERSAASLLSRTLFAIRDMAPEVPPEQAKEKALDLLSASPLILPDYLVIADASTLRSVGSWDEAPAIIALLAAKVGQTRLIDNLFIKGTV